MRLAEAMPTPRELREIAAWCWTRAAATGESKYCFLAGALQAISREWSEFDALPAWVDNEIGAIFARQLLPVLDTKSPVRGAKLARALEGPSRMY
jgi:hypothetical protein